MSKWQRSGLIFGITLLAHGWLWHHFPPIDESLWITHYLELGNNITPLSNQLVSVYPGVTITSLAWIMHSWFGVAAVSAFRGSLALLVAMSIAAIIQLIQYMQPNSRWWYSVAIVLIINHFYLRSVPATILAMPLTALVIILTHVVHQQRILGSNSYKLWLVLWGIAVGISAATRLDIALIVGLTMLPIAAGLNWRNCILASGIAFVTFFSLISIWWPNPVTYISQQFELLYMHHRAININPTQDPPFLLIAHMPIGIAAFILTTSRLLVNKGYTPAIKTTIKYTLIATLIFGIIAFTSNFHSAHHWFPIAITWEVLFVVFFLDSLKPLSLFSRIFRIRTQFRMNVLLSTLLLAGQVALTIHLLWLGQTHILCWPDRALWDTLLCNQQRAIMLW